MMIQLSSDNKETLTSISSDKIDLAQLVDLRVLIHKILMSNLADPSSSTLPLEPSNPHHSVICLQNTRSKMNMYASKALNLETKKSYFWIISDEIKKGIENIGS